jgi:hypothetical protein
MQGITAISHMVLLFIIFYFCGLHFNHLFIWLDPEVVAHDELIATKSGYLNFPFDCESSYILIDGIYIDIILLKLFGTR